MKHAIRNLLRFAAVALFLFGTLLLGLEIARRGLSEEPIHFGNCILGGALLLGGTIVFAISARIAAWLSDEDDDDPPDATIEIPPPES